MAFSTQRAVSDGTLQLLSLSINFFDKSEITVYLNNVPTTAYTWATANSIHMNSVVPNGVELLVRRTTDLSDVRHVFSLGAQFKDSTLDDDFRQILHIAQEAVEGANVGDIYSTLNMHGNSITNVGPAVADGDAINLGQVRTESQGAYLANTQAQAAASAAASSQGAAAASASASATSATLSQSQVALATTQAGNAASSASASATSATASDTARAAAVTAQSAAAASSSLAQKWAAEVEDTVVSGGLYSAYHYSRKAAASATASSGSAAAAAASAASISMPSITGKSLQFLRANAGETALEYVPFTTVFRANLVGTVSGTGAAPTGAVLQTGSNANGEWEKFADGRAVITRKITVTRAINTVLGSSNCYYDPAGLASVAFPITLTSVQSTSIRASCDTGGVTGTNFTGGATGEQSPSLSAWGFCFLTEYFSRASQTYTIWYRAEGRWD